jgi:hypothetical protein
MTISVMTIGDDDTMDGHISDDHISDGQISDDHP